MFPDSDAGQGSGPVMPGDPWTGDYRPEMAESEILWDDVDNEEYKIKTTEAFLDSAVKEGTYNEPMAGAVPDEGISSTGLESKLFDYNDREEEISAGSITDVEEGEGPVSDLVANFNLPEAIVWSEIINRKENF